MFKKPEPEPSFDDRLISAQLIASNATFDFSQAARLLEQEANALEVLEQEVTAEIERLGELRLAAEADAERNRAIALSLRSLVEPELVLF